MQEVVLSCPSKQLLSNVRDRAVHHAAVALYNVTVAACRELLSDIHPLVAHSESLRRLVSSSHNIFNSTPHSMLGSV